jgi:hydroxypyruvate reductase
MNINGSRNGALKSDLRRVFTEAVQSVEGCRCVERYLQQHPLGGDVCVIAVGKAACQMAAGAQRVLDEKMQEGLVITKRGYYGGSLSGFRVVEAGHPLPDQNSLQAGELLLALIADIPVTTRLLFLVSGGTSALVDVLPPSLTIEHLQQLNQWLLHSGLPIDKMNAIRKQVSAIKGGRLARYLEGRDTMVLIISDVQSDDPAIIGSGLLFPSGASLSPADRQSLPAEIQRMLTLAPPMPAPGDQCFHGIHWQIIANIQQAVAAAAAAARDLGYAAEVHDEYLQGDAVETGEKVAAIMQSRPGRLHIWGGETTVTLPENPGTGGRCQTLALSAAIALHHERHKRWALLSAGTDGDDGNSGVAGVCADATSIDRACSTSGVHFDPGIYLQRADASTLFTASGDLLQTGPTGTNVTDIILGYYSDDYCNVEVKNSKI